MLGQKRADRTPQTEKRMGLIEAAASGDVATIDYLLRQKAMDNDWLDPNARDSAPFFLLIELKITIILYYPPVFQAQRGNNTASSNFALEIFLT